MSDKDPVLTALLSIFVVTVIASATTCSVGMKQQISFHERCVEAGGIPRYTKYDGNRCMTREAVERDEINLDGINTYDLNRAKKSEQERINGPVPAEGSLARTCYDYPSSCENLYRKRNLPLYVNPDSEAGAPNERSE